METIIHPSEYFDGEVFKQELKKIFSTHWLFAGFYRDLADAGNYIRVTLPENKSVIVKNFDGELRAFLNVCSHRYSRLCSEKKGSGSLVCPYHGWSYNKEGIPSIPLKKNFCSKLNTDALRLKTFKVARCGEFVFVADDECQIDLNTYLGTYADLLQTISQALGESIDVNEMSVDANWKINVENTLEEYHVRKVHPESINKLGLGAQKYAKNSSHSMAEMTVAHKLEDDKRMHALFGDRLLSIDGYNHYLIFPYMTVATTYGISFSVQTFIPIGAEKTLFTSYVFGTKLPGDNSNSKYKMAHGLYVKELNRKIFHEDKLICEEVQAGSRLTHRQSSPLCSLEERVYWFQKVYKELMNNDS